MAAREKTLRANGLRHHVVEWGTAREDTPSVVLCHGFLDIAWGYRALGERLAARGYHAIAFDWRGHGETEWIGRGGYYHFADYVLDLHELLPQLTPRPCHLVGHSMGGTVCSMFAGTHSERLASLTLMEGLGPPAMPGQTAPARLQRWLQAVEHVRAAAPHTLASTEEAWTRLQRRNPDLPEDFGRFIAEKSTRSNPDGPGVRWCFDPLHRTPSAVGFDVDRFLEYVRAIQVRTLCLVGSRGMRTGDDDRRYAALRQALRVEIPDTGHMLQWTAPDAVGEALLEFFNKS